jgi:hypothetical protein
MSFCVNYHFIAGLFEVRIHGRLCMLKLSRLWVEMGPPHLAVHPACPVLSLDLKSLHRDFFAGLLLPSHYPITVHSVSCGVVAMGTSIP